MINFNTTTDKKVDYNVRSISVKRQPETNNTILSDGNNKSDVDCFNELCKKFPYASFVVEDNSLNSTEQEWLPARFLGNSDLQNFSNLETLSIAFDKKIFDKAAHEPEFMEYLTNFVERLNNELPFMKTQCLNDGMQFMYMNMFLKEDGTIGYTTGEYHGKDTLYYGHVNNLDEWQNDDTSKRILEEYEKQKQEGLFAMMDKIHENSEELKEQIENDMHLEKIQKEYEKTFLFKNERSLVQTI